MRSSDSTPADRPRMDRRFYLKDGAWFYATREGEHGPFASRDDAARDAEMYAGLHSHLEQVRDRSRGDSEG